MFKTMLWRFLNQCKEVPKSFENSGQSKKVCSMESNPLHIIHIFHHLQFSRIGNDWMIFQSPKNRIAVGTH